MRRLEAPLPPHQSPDPASVPRACAHLVESRAVAPRNPFACDVLRPLLLIPARLASTRLPNKPLADIAGKPMIVQVLDRAREADLGPVVVACDDAGVAEIVTAAGGIAVLTRADHPSGSDRIFEAIGLFDPDGAMT